MLGGAVLSEVERKMVNEHPAIGKNLICSIPRLEAVAEMIFRQTWRYADIRAIAGYASDPACVGGAILKAVIDYDAMLYSGLPPARALELMHRDRDAYNMVILDILAAAAPLAVEHEVKALTVSELKAGMVLAEDVRSRNGVLILAKGQEVTDALRRRLENCLVQGTLDNVIRVQLK